LTLRNIKESILMCLAIALLCANALAKADGAPSDEHRRLLPDQLGGFRADGPVLVPGVDKGVAEGEMGRIAREEFGAYASAARLYLAKDGEVLAVGVYDFRSESAAYAFLTDFFSADRDIPETDYGVVGTASRTYGDVLVFVQGSTVVEISPIGTALNRPANTKLARAMSDLVGKGSGEIPSLAKHLPEWDTAKKHSAYAVSLKSLIRAMPGQSALDAVNFDGGTEAVVADYGPSKLVIIEFTTPQLASDNDRRIIEKIHELWKEGKPSPTAYRRVGNYSVFVFNAPNEQTANQLIDQVKYEQVVQWLGDNPYWLRDAQKRDTETMLGTFVSVVKASGLAAVLCLGVGALMGALLFTRRRAQQAAQQGYSDAGGMMRLNIDELTSETDPHRLLGPEKP
jgi:hypothetical protein